jgi:hypothetical protein
MQAPQARKCCDGTPEASQSGSLKTLWTLKSFSKWAARFVLRQLLYPPICVLHHLILFSILSSVARISIFADAARNMPETQTSVKDVIPEVGGNFSLDPNVIASKLYQLKKIYFPPTHR